MQIGRKGIWNLFMNIVLEKEKFKTQIWKTPFHASSFGNRLPINPSLELSNVQWWLLDPKVIQIRWHFTTRNNL
jgi:hypothetical protein